MIPNTAELVAVYQHIKAHPEQWNQQLWGCRNECGTAFCFAGHAVVRAGAELAWEVDFVTDDGTFERADFLREPIRGIYTIAGYASHVLGLNGPQSNDLFAGDNTLEDLRRIITEITSVDPEPGGAS